MAPEPPSRKEFHEQFPTLRQYFLKTSQMKKEHLQMRDKLHEFWSEDQGNGKGVRVTWNSQPVAPYIATLASLQRPDLRLAKKFCMRFNGTYGCSAPNCGYDHVCLFCGCKNPGTCTFRKKLDLERERFFDRYELDALEPCSPAIGESEASLQESLQRLARDAPQKASPPMQRASGASVSSPPMASKRKGSDTSSPPKGQFAALGSDDDATEARAASEAPEAPEAPADAEAVERVPSKSLSAPAPQDDDASSRQSVEEVSGLPESGVEEEFKNLPPPPPSREMTGSDGKLPFWTYLPESTLPPGALLCPFIFDTKHPNPKLAIPRCNLGKPRCEKAHKWKQLRLSQYQRNKPLAHAPDYLQVFHMADWGMGHGEAPRMEIKFEDTYPTAVTRAIKMCVDEPKRFQEIMGSCVKSGKLTEKCLPNPSWQGMLATLCYNFTLKDGKCPKWHNCYFLHVENGPLREQFKRHRCQCGPNFGICKYGKYDTCLYAHKQEELTYPAELEESGYPESEQKRTLWGTGSLSKMEVAIEIPEKFIANTDGRAGSFLCAQMYDWCNRKDCEHGVHLTPKGWAWLAQNHQGERPDPPPYLKKQVRKFMPITSVSKENKWKQGAPKLKPRTAYPEVKRPPDKLKANPKQEGPPVQEEEPGDDTAASYTNTSEDMQVLTHSKPINSKVREEEPSDDAAARYTTVEDTQVSVVTSRWGKKVVVEDVKADEESNDDNVSAASKPRNKMAIEEESDDEDAASYPNASEDKEESAASSPPKTVIEDEEVLTYHALLKFPAFAKWKDPDSDEEKEEAKDEDYKKLSASESERLKNRWQGGLSHRFKDDYRKWLESGSMNKSFLEEGNIYFHPKLSIGKGAAAEVYLGIQPSDGREVGVKVLEEEDDEDQFTAKHFESERITLKQNTAIPGVVQYVNSFERTYKGRRKRMREMVVVVELMEGSLADAMKLWTKNKYVGTLAHLVVIRYVAASLLYTLANLNHGRSQEHFDLVHRDVKPDNIMLDHLGQVRLGDFGLAKLLEKKADYYKLSSGLGPVAYASPEALADLRATRTSDLYSLGMVMLAMMLANPEGERLPRDRRAQLETLRKQIPPEWPKHHSYCFTQLLSALLEQDAKVRAFTHWTPSTITPHRLVLSHPFFWPAQNGLRFLVTLGTYTIGADDGDPADPGQFKLSQFQGLEDAVRAAIEQALKETKGETWLDLVQMLEQTGKGRDTKEDRKNIPFGLLKFIRNKYIHLNDSKDPKIVKIRSKLQEQPGFFQQRFPELVARSWEALLKYSINKIRADMQHAQLREFFERPIELESFRDTSGHNANQI